MPLLSAIAAVFATLSSIHTGEIKTQLEQRALALQSETATRLDRESQQQLDFRLYDALKASLLSGNASEQEAVRALVTTMADSAFAEKLLGDHDAHDARGSRRVEV